MQVTLRRPQGASQRTVQEATQGEGFKRLVRENLVKMGKDEIQKEAEILKIGKH